MIRFEGFLRELDVIVGVPEWRAGVGSEQRGCAP
jgi:hypothetical protein